MTWRNTPFSYQIYAKTFFLLFKIRPALIDPTRWAQNVFKAIYIFKKFRNEVSVSCRFLSPSVCFCHYSWGYVWKFWSMRRRFTLLLLLLPFLVYKIRRASLETLVASFFIIFLSPFKSIKGTLKPPSKGDLQKEKLCPLFLPRLPIFIWSKLHVSVTASFFLCGEF